MIVVSFAKNVCYQSQISLNEPSCRFLSNLNYRTSAILWTKWWISRPFWHCHAFWQIKIFLFMGLKSTMDVQYMEGGFCNVEGTKVYLDGIIVCSYVNTIFSCQFVYSESTQLPMGPSSNKLGWCLVYHIWHKAMAQKIMSHTDTTYNKLTHMFGFLCVVNHYLQKCVQWVW